MTKGMLNTVDGLLPSYTLVERLPRLSNCSQITFNLPSCWLLQLSKPALSLMVTPMANQQREDEFTSSGHS